MIIVKCQGDYYKLLNKLNYINVFLYNVSYKDSYIYLTINKKDLTKLKKYLPSYKFILENELGFSRVKRIIKRYNYFFIAILVGLVSLFFLSNIIVKVEVIHSSKHIRYLLYNALDDEGIRRLTIKKDYQTLNRIKERILKKYPNDLEWIEIEVHGMKYVVRVEQRIIDKPSKEKSSCNVVALKSGIITDIITHKGESLVTRGDYVSKGDILIRGNIMFNNEIKETVCATGIVQAEVWYTVKVSMPLTYNEKRKTGKKRRSIVYDKGLGREPIFKNNYKIYDYHDRKLFSFFNTNFYIRTIEEIKLLKKTYTKEEAITKATLLALEKINIKKKEQDKIITQKVLKKEINDSTINLEIFFAVEEEIGKEVEFLKSNEVE